MLREYHKWQSPVLGREMELLSFGHGGARVIVFPTSNGRFFDWENRGLIDTLSGHINKGWIQVFCVDSVDPESWFNQSVAPEARATRHLQYQDYIINEVLPFTKSKNDNDFTIATGASFGAYHSMSIVLRYPQFFSRAIGMSGVYDVRDWTGGYMDQGPIREASPCEYLAALDDRTKLEQIKKLDLIIPIGVEDPLYGNNKWFSSLLWQKGIWHAFREWRENAHDWPYWHQMILQYIGGPDSGN